MSEIGKAIEVYGTDHQLNIVIEELSELIKEICKHKRGYLNRTNIVEEMADTYIVLKQLQMIFCVTDKELAETEKYKIDRLANTINKYLQERKQSNE